VSQRRLKEARARCNEFEKEQAELTSKWQKERREIDSMKRAKERLESSRTDLDQAINNGNSARAAELQYSIIPGLEEQLASLSVPSEESRMLAESVNSDDVAEVLASATGIPVQRLKMGEKQRLLALEDQLRSRVVGQEPAVSALANSVRMSRAGLHSHDRPMGSFLFTGPSGVGKTELAKAVAEHVFDDEKCMTRIDMSEYMDKYTVSRLIGAPPGYVGYEEGGLLTEAVHRKPYQVLLFDEFEKAHSDVSNLMLQVLDEGHLTDSQGRRVDMRNTLIIMTSNMLPKALQQNFRPEFLNRIDEIVEFAPLSEETMSRITTMRINELRSLLAEQELTIEVKSAAADWLAENGFDPEYGARPLQRLINQHVLHPLSRQILEGKHSEGHVNVDIASQGLDIKLL